MSGKVYVVCAIDTEGPIDDPRKPEILNTWGRVDDVVTRMTAEDFRCRYPDSLGQGLKYSWFILHLTGFKTNPFNRPMGYNEVFDHYLDVHRATIEQNQDGVYWHYHQPAPSGIGNEWCRDWTHCTEYNTVLSHLVLDRQFFPTCFRAGGRIEDDDLSNWIEQWIPFDYSNNSGNVNWEKRESDGKRLLDVCDWTRAPQEWYPYHPSVSDYQEQGEQKRWMFRCPDLNSPVHVMSDEEIRKAFQAAKEGRDVVLAFFEHDRRENVLDHINDICRRIHVIGTEFPKINWCYQNAQIAAQDCLGLNRAESVQFNMEWRQVDRIFISANGKVFGNQPFVCVQRNNEYEEVPLQAIGQQKWISGHLGSGINKVGVAANTPGGNSCVEIFQGDFINNFVTEMEGKK